MPRLCLAVLCAAALPPAPALAADLCAAWSEPETLGELDTRLISEASGLELSARFPDRLYHHNDSGDGPNLYVTGPDGADARRIEIAGFRPRDVEDIAAGPCGGASCLFLADIGDNSESRDAVRIVVAEEPGAEPPARLAPRAIIDAAYPDGAHNAEAAAVHPDGDLYVLTKTDSVAGLYRLRAAQLAEGGGQQFEFVTDIDLRALLGPERRRAPLATAMDIAPDGSRFLVLTYTRAAEFAVDLSASGLDPSAWREGEDFRVIRTAQLLQAEAAAYGPDGASILYTTESVRGAPAPVMRQTCLD